MIRRSTTISAVAALLAASCSAQNPSAIYNGGYNSTNATIELRIGNGGAGQSGLVGCKYHHPTGKLSTLISIVTVLADEFIKDSVKNGSELFTVAWYTSDTTYSIEYLSTGLLDVGITYSPAAEQIAVNQGIAVEPIY